MSDSLAFSRPFDAGSSRRGSGAATDAGKRRRTLLTLPRKDVERIEITGYDPILRIFFLQAI